MGHKRWAFTKARWQQFSRRQNDERWRREERPSHVRQARAGRKTIARSAEVAPKLEASCDLVAQRGLTYDRPEPRLPRSVSAGRLPKSWDLTVSRVRFEGSSRSRFHRCTRPADRPSVSRAATARGPS